VHPQYWRSRDDLVQIMRTRRANCIPNFTEQGASAGAIQAAESGALPDRSIQRSREALR
jgi:hypothetical protein